MEPSEPNDSATQPSTEPPPGWVHPYASYPQSYGGYPAGQPIGPSQPGYAPAPGQAGYGSQPGQPGYPPAYGYWPQHPGQQHMPPPPPARSGRGWMIAGIAGVAAGAIALGVAVGDGGLFSSSTGGTGSAGGVVAAPFIGGSEGGSGSGSGSGGGSGSGSGSGSGGQTGGGTSSGGTTASADQSIGIVNIDTVLGYENGEAAGTGMILNSDGLVLTNNHVIDGSTKIQVTVISTGKTYDATVVGDDPTDDVAVIQMTDASGLTTAKIGTSKSVAVGDAVVAVGNAGGTGTPTQATGKVTDLNQSITATDETGANAEQLTGLIETDADVVAGDSGGPLYDSSGQIIGIDTAGAETNESSTDAQSYAIPIDSAVALAKQITSGTSNSTIHQGLPAFLGVELAPATTGTTGGNRRGGGITNGGTTGGGTTGGTDSAAATVVGVIDNTPAATLGIAEGDTITAIDGTQIATATDLSTALAAHKPGDTVTVTWTDATGASQSGQATLIEGPAD